MENLTASNFRVAGSSEVILGAATRTELPDQVIVNDNTIQDCSPNPATQQVTLQESFQRSESVQISHSITNSVSDQMGFQWKVSDVFTLSGQIQIGRSETSGQAKTSGSQESITRSQTGSITVKPQETTVAELRVWPIRYAVPFHATVTIDADLSANDKGFRVLSDILDGPSRTFDISGTIEADDASEGELVFYDIPFDPATCGGTTHVAVRKHVRFVPHTRFFEHSDK